MGPESLPVVKRHGIFRRRGVLVALVALPVLAFFGGNLLLTNPWTLGWLAGKVRQRTGLESRIGSCTWSPWNGISVGSFQLLQPEPLRDITKGPLLEVREIRASPVWRAVLRGRLELRDIELDTPRVEMPLELLSHLAKAAIPQVQPPLPPVAAATPSAPASGETPPAAPPAVASNGQPPAQPAPADQPPPSSPVLEPTAWIKVKNGSLRLVFAAKDLGLLEMTGVSGSIPVAGKPARSPLKVGSISALGEEVANALSTELIWKSPLLALPPLELELHGCKFAIAGQLVRSAGTPVQVLLQAPRQKTGPFPIPFGSTASMEEMAVEARLRGLLLAPASWQGDFRAQATNPIVRESNRVTTFERAGMVAVLRGGLLSCPDFRLVGEDVSLLGNATVLADGRCAGALRFVGKPDTAVHAAKRVFPMLKEPSLTPLGTPQRVAFDLEAHGDISQISLRLGRDGPVLHLKP